MSRLLLVTPFLIVLSAGAQAPEDNRPPLFFREDWKAIAAVTPVTQEHVANPKLLVALYGPGKDGIRKSHHDTPKDDPYYIWLGSCPANCAIALRDKDAFVDLTGRYGDLELKRQLDRRQPAHGLLSKLRNR